MKGLSRMCKEGKLRYRFFLAWSISLMVLLSSNSICAVNPDQAEIILYRNAMFGVSESASIKFSESCTALTKRPITLIYETPWHYVYHATITIIPETSSDLYYNAVRWGATA